MEIGVVVLSIPLFFALIGIELVAARIEHRRLYRLPDALTNISCGIADQVSGVFAGVLSVALYAFSYEFRIWDAPNHWLWWLAAFVMIDLMYYWSHRMSHEINLFWAGHVVHHQSEDYNLSVALRQSALQKLFSMWFYIPVALAGFPPAWFALSIGLNLLYQFWIHTEMIGKLPRWFEWLMNTPSHHRVHHGRDPKYIDKNHAGVFIIWDRMFGTFQQEEERPHYGITTPLNSWNPLYAQVQHFENIRADLKQVKGFGAKLGVLFNKPGWLPAEAGGYRAPRPVDPLYHKFDLRVPRDMNVYLLGQYVLLLVGTSAFLFSLNHLGWGDRGLAAVVILMATMSLGMLFEGKKWGVRLEVTRLLAGAALTLYLLWGTPWFWWAALPAAAVQLLSLLWLRHAMQRAASPSVSISPN